MNNLISIIIPTHNRAHLISRAIQSVIEQTYTNWELIIVDDGSTDNTENVLQPFLKDDRIKYVKKENSGAAHSRNVGVEKASGDWITFLDSDDEVNLNWLSEIVSMIETESPHLICCGCDKIDSEGNIIDKILPDEDPYLFGNVTYLMIGGTFAIKRSVFDKVGGYDWELRSGQHTELAFRIIPLLQRENKKIANIFKSLIKIHIHLGERIRGNPSMKIEGTLRSLDKHKEFFKKRKELRANYEGTVGRNAFLLGKKRKSMEYFLKSFQSKPSLTRFGRILFYSFRNLVGK